MASLNVPARSMTQTARTAAVGQRAPRATPIVQAVPAVRDRVILQAGVAGTAVQAVPVRLAEAPLQEKPGASRVAPGISIRRVTDRCSRGGLAQIVRRVRIVRLVKNVSHVSRTPRASVRRKRLASVDTNPHVQGSVLRIVHVRWRGLSKIPAVTAMQANA
jgi:hypothetical protein